MTQIQVGSRGPYYCKCKLSSFNAVNIKLLCLKFDVEILLRCCILKCLIWIYTVYADLSFQILRVNTVTTEKKIFDVLTLVLMKKMLVCIYNC